MQTAFARALVAAWLACAGPALAQAPAAAPVTAATPPIADYVLGPADVIETQVLGHMDFTSRAKISEDGTVQLPYLGKVRAGGETAAQLSDQLTKSLEQGGYFSRPIVRVEIVAYASRYVVVLGAVGQPGLTPVDRPYHLSEILARVGGVRGDAAEYVVVRSEKGEPQHYSIKALATGDPSQDPLVQPGDKIFCPVAETFYISGQIRAPGGYPLLTAMTLRMAIARAGGLTDLGTDRNVKITRGGKKLDHADLDSPVQPGDVIAIGARLF